MTPVTMQLAWSSWDPSEADGQVGYHGRLGRIGVGDVHADVDVWHWRLDPLFADYVEPAAGMAGTGDAAKACVEESVREWLRLAGLQVVEHNLA